MWEGHVRCLISMQRNPLVGLKALSVAESMETLREMNAVTPPMHPRERQLQALGNSVLPPPLKSERSGMVGCSRLR